MLGSEPRFANLGFPERNGKVQPGFEPIARTLAATQQRHLLCLHVFFREKPLVFSRDVGAAGDVLPRRKVDVVPGKFLQVVVATVVFGPAKKKTHPALLSASCCVS